MEITSKDQLTRNMVHDTKMKIVIIRLDYSGVEDLSALIKIFDDKIKCFKSRRELYNNQMNVTLREEDLATISKSLSIPVNVIRKEKIWRYFDSTLGVCETTLDISQYFMCMTIKSENNYDGLDIYSSVFKEAAELFKSEISYFEPKRLGLRKVRIEDFKDLADSADIFESNVFCLNHKFTETDPTYLEKHYKDVLINDCKNRLWININRSIKYFDTDAIYKSALDIDAYYQDDKSLSETPITDLLSEANEIEFNIYKSCMTFEYLKSIINE